MRYRPITIWMILLFGLHLHGQIITVNADFNSDSILIGEHVNYTLTVESAVDLDVQLPEYSDTITGDIEILNILDTDTSYANDKRILSREYVVTSFTPGWNTVSPQAVVFHTNELQDTVYTTALLLTVLAPAVDTTQAIKPIKPPVNTPLSFAEIVPWALIGLGGILIIILIIYLIKRYIRKKQNPEYYAKKQMEPAHIIAFRELDLLKKEKLPQNGRVKEYYTRLTWIIREYITRQFGIYALESTTGEILEAFTTQSMADDKLGDMLENLLMLADLVKFAKEDPLMEENDRHLANAVSFVESTHMMFDKIEEEKLSEDIEINSEPEKEEENHG